MTTESHDRFDDLGDLAESFRRLRPAAGDLDPTSVFYQAGVQAGLAQREHHVRPIIAAMIGGLLVGLVAAPVGYLGGQASLASRTSEVARVRQPTIRELPRQPSGGREDVGQRNTGQEGSPPAEPPEPVPMVATEPPSADSHRSVVSDWGDSLAFLWQSRSRSLSEASSLAAFHSRESSGWSMPTAWPEFFVLADARMHREPLVGNRIGSGQSIKPLAVNDLQLMTQSLESIR